MIRHATFSKDRTKRFQLVRDWRDESQVETWKLPTVNFIMLNPSKAGEVDDDPTIRKCIGFARRWGYWRLLVTNLIPIVSTDPWKLPYWSGIDPDNRVALSTNIQVSDLVVAAWGNQPNSLRNRVCLSEHIYSVLRLSTADFYCIGTTQNGSPLHPSRTKYTDKPEFWKESEE